MSSVGVIWSAVARIKCLKEVLTKLPSEAELLLQGLEGILVLLRESQCPKTREEEEEFVELEKKIVRVSYEIVDAIVDASYKSKETFSLRKKDGKAKLKELQTKLDGLQHYLDTGSDPELIQEVGVGVGVGVGVSPTSSNKLIQSTKSGIMKLAKLERKSSSEFIDGFKNMLFVRTEKKKKPDHLSDIQEAEAEADTTEGDAEAEAEVGNNFLLHKLKEDLSNPSSEFSVVYIVGESGMGKTTLTRKLFNELQHQHQPFFNVFAWVPMNHNFKIKKVLQLLLQKLNMGPFSQEQDIRAMSEINLIARIFAALRNNNSLLVLDDIASLDHWESIRLALPFANSTKVIVTTSSKDFLQLPNSFQIPGLTRTEILMLLRKEQIVEPDSNEVENAIYDITGGSPLFATILGEFFQSEAACTTSTGHHHLVDELLSYNSQKGKPQVLGACYKRLAPELKPCFLYLGQFPQGRDIEVDKLYLLLMAENLIIPAPDDDRDSNASLESLKHNLKELARKKLVEVQEDYKSCRLHDRVRVFCNRKGLDEELFEIVDLESSAKVSSHTRRLAIYLSKYRGDNPIQCNNPDTLKKILSLLIFDTFESAEEKSEWPPEINDLKEFSHVRVVNFDGVDFTARKVPRGIDKLVLLRYLSFRGCRLDELPPSMSNLTQLETLDLSVHADCKKMLVPNNIFAKMTRMRHLYFPRLYATSNGKTKVQLQGLVMLEILVNFDTEACDVNDLSEFKNLEILSVISNGKTIDLEVVLKFINRQGEKVQHSSIAITSFDCYNRGSASALEKLLDCRFLHSIHIEGRIGELPEEDSRANKVEDMVLSGSELESDPMNYLGKLHNLQSLVLSNDAFLGSEIVISAAPLFPNLRRLKLQKLQYLENLRIEGGAMPMLSTLKVESCGCLEEMSIPKELHDKLKKAQGDNGGGVYSVMPLPTQFNITT